MKLKEVFSVAAPGAETEKCVAVVTVKTSKGVEVMPPWTAVMLLVPPVTPEACPCVPEVLLIVATGVFEEFQVAVFVRFCVLLSE